MQPFKPDSLPERLRWLLEEGFFAYFGTADAKGNPHVTPVTFIFDGESIFTITSKYARKIRNLRENPKSAMLIDVRDPQDPRNNRAVLLQGEAKVYGVLDCLLQIGKILKLNRLIKGKYPHYFEFYMKKWRHIPDAWKPCLFRSRLIIRFNPKAFTYMRETMPTKLDGGSPNFNPQTFMENSPFAYLCTVDVNLQPHVVPVFYWFEEGRIWLVSALNSKKLKNLRVNSRVCLTMDSRDPVNPFNNAGIMVWGMAEIHRAIQDLQALKAFMDGRLYRGFQEKYGFFEEWLMQALSFPLTPIEVRIKRMVFWKGPWFKSFKLGKP
ncbi:MAG: pyridoxamine 5'-phosphate oxidase family protein [Candidatus Hecatellaceae archaeon]